MAYKKANIIRIHLFLIDLLTDTLCKHNRCFFLFISDYSLFYFHSNNKRKMSTVRQEATATTGSAVAHTAVSENVSVKSVVSTETQSKVSMENTQKMAALMSKLGKQ